jgi:hypothetical protein
MVTTLLGTRRTLTPPRRTPAFARWTRGHSRPIGRCRKDVLLVGATLAFMIGLGAVMASLVPFAYETRMLHPHRSHNLGAGTVVAAMSNRSPGSTPTSWRGRSPRRTPPPTAVADLWRSPLYPQNGVTLWDRLRASSPRDRRAFLLSTAFQIHAPATAATPSPHRVYPSKEG